MRRVHAARVRPQGSGPIDGQGRLLIHPLLRKSAEVLGDVAVLGYLTYLEVWELDKFKARMLADPYTEEDEAAIARLGI